MTRPWPDVAFLEDFEAGLDPRRPERGAVPARVLGHGEITTVLEISPGVTGAPGGTGAPGDAAPVGPPAGGSPSGAPRAGLAGRSAAAAGPDGVARKRMPMFRGPEEAAAYHVLFHEYQRILVDEVGLDLARGELAWLGWDPGRAEDPRGSGTGADAPRARPGRARGRAGRGRTRPIVLYILQELLPPSSIGHVRLRGLARADALELLADVLREMDKVFSFNEANRGRLEVGFDGQISNWAVVDRPGAPGSSLRYLDTSTPLLRREGVEQLDPELFLRSAPSFLAWIIRRFMLADVMARYYDRRKVAVDLVANFYKEQRPDLVPEAVGLVNRYLTAAGAAPVTEDEVRAYYREDARIWRVYLAFRKIDRLLHRLMGKEYPYILPGKVVR